MNTDLDGVVLVTTEPHRDERGHFARSFCKREFEARGLPTAFVQQSLSWNEQAGTLRGLHFQHPPQLEGKLVRCTQGAIFDVVVDLRPESRSFREWRSFDLRPRDGTQLYIPPGFAHGFETLEDATEVTYQMTAYYEPGADGGIRWDDPSLNIPWPMPPTRLSERDRALPLLSG